MRHRTSPSHRQPIWPRFAFLLAVAMSLVAGVLGGLARAGVSVVVTDSAWAGAAVSGHAFLMICTFMGTVIGIERAVAVKHRLAFAPAAATALAGALWLAGCPGSAAWLATLASLGFIAVNAAIVKRQRAAHTVVLLVAALAWAAGCVVHALGASLACAVPLWFCFLVLTIAAERLEMTRLMRRRRGAAAALHVIFGTMLVGAMASAVSPTWGGLLYGLSLSALAVWLVLFDVARRTVRVQGLSRYMAVCLLLGYLWLFVAGAAWAAMAAGLPWRDVALHALALGFIFSMMLGHAPVILPAIARVKVLFSRAYYVPLALLHGSLLVRLGAGHFDFDAFAAGAAGNALAIAAFAATTGGSAIAWRLRHGSTSNKDRHGVSAEA